MAERFQKYVEENQRVPGIQLLQEIIDYGIHTKQFEPDEWVYELVDEIIGDNDPNPDRMLVRTEQVVHDFLSKELCGQDTSCGTFDLFAVEGATAAMCYIFDTLYKNHILPKGSKIAVMDQFFHRTLWLNMLITVKGSTKFSF